jgi:hypothetical protein
MLAVGLRGGVRAPAVVVEFVEVLERRQRLPHRWFGLVIRGVGQQRRQQQGACESSQAHTFPPIRCLVSCKQSSPRRRKWDLPLANKRALTFSGPDC